MHTQSGRDREKAKERGTDRKREGRKESKEEKDRKSKTRGPVGALIFPILWEKNGPLLLVLQLLIHDTESQLRARTDGNIAEEERGNWKSQMRLHRCDSHRDLDRLKVDAIRMLSIGFLLIVVLLFDTLDRPVCLANIGPARELIAFELHLLRNCPVLHLPTHKQTLEVLS